MVPTFFWRRLVREIKATVKPEIMMLSEGALPEHHVGAFDITYAWNVYDVLTAIVRRLQPAAYLHHVLETEAKEFPQGALRLRFISNHDKNATDGTPLEHFGGIPAAFALSALIFTMGGYESIRSVPMLYNGDELGNTHRLSLFDKTVIPWSDLAAQPTGQLFRCHYETLIKLRKRRSSLLDGSMHKAPTSYDESVFAFVRASTPTSDTAEEVLVVVNLRDQPLQDLEVILPTTIHSPNEADLIHLENWYKEDEPLVETKKEHKGKLVLQYLQPFGFCIFGLQRKSH